VRKTRGDGAYANKFSLLLEEKGSREIPASNYKGWKKSLLQLRKEASERA
jgi:hypothetical protein